MKPIITLTTDWGLKDYFTGALKGALYKEIPDVNIVDISHLIAAYNILQASYTFRNAWKNFPDGTIHFIGVDSGTDPTNGLIAIAYQQHIFIGFDCGIFSMVFEEKPTQMFRLFSDTDFTKQQLTKFLVPLLSELTEGKTLNELGTPIDKYMERTYFVPTIEDMHIIGHVIYTDEYGNLVTNIEHHVFDFVKGERNFSIHIKSRDYTIKKISKWYDEVPQGELLAMVNDAGFLEIAVCGGRASQMFNMKYGSTIRIEFNDNKNSKADHKSFSLS
ncbi:MAG: SAM-dependent chlorinase/fluorinase [Bacteroidia bacterium]